MPPPREKSGTLDYIKIKSEQAGVKIHAPHSVHPGLVEVVGQ